MRSLTRTHGFLIGGVAFLGMLAALPATARGAVADLELTLTEPSKTPPIVFQYGETKTYTVTIANLGPSTATGVEITTINVPAPLKLVSISGCKPVTAGVPVPCTVDDGQVIDEPVPTALPKDFVNTKSVTFDVELPVPLVGDPAVPTLPTVCPDGTGLAAITVTVGLASTSTTTDPNPANNSATSSVPTIGQFADLSIAMTAPATASIGGTMDVTATITNNGPCTSNNVEADDEQGVTALTLKPLSVTGDCDVDPLGGTCSWASLAPSETKMWTITYEVLGFPPSLMKSGEPVSLTVFTDPKTGTFDPDSSNDVAQTQTIVKKKNVPSCSTGGMGGALSLLVLAVPFMLRRRRKS